MTLIEPYAEEDPRPRPLQIYKPSPDQKMRHWSLRVSQRAAHVRASRGDYLSSALLRKLNKELQTQPDTKFAAHFAKLDALSTDRFSPDGCNEPPSILALTSARRVLHQLQTEGLEPTRIVSSSEGGVAICFLRGEKYSDIECLNSEEILGVVSNRRDPPIVWEIDPSASGFARAAARIRDFLGGPSSAHDAERQTR